MTIPMLSFANCPQKETRGRKGWRPEEEEGRDQSQDDRGWRKWFYAPRGEWGKRVKGRGKGGRVRGAASEYREPHLSSVSCVNSEHSTLYILCVYCRHGLGGGGEGCGWRGKQNVCDKSSVCASGEGAVFTIYIKNSRPWTADLHLHFTGSESLMGEWHIFVTF